MIRIRKYRNSDLKKVVKLVYSLFMKHVIKDANAKGRIYWRKYLSFNRTNLGNLKTRYEGSTIAYVATFQGEIIGVMMGDKHEMVRLFIKDRFQRKGLGTRLMELYERKVEGLGSKGYKIVSGLSAVPFYQRLGCKKSGRTKLFHNLRIQQMVKKL